jgi:hypothetical protein
MSVLTAVRPVWVGRTYESHFGYCSRFNCYILNSVNAAAYKSSRRPLILTGDCDERIYAVQPLLKKLAITFAAGLALTAIMASAASAAPEWYVKKAGAWSKVSTAVNVEGGEKGSSFEVIDTKYAVGQKFGVSCRSDNTGQVKAGGIGSISSLPGVECKPSAFEKNQCATRVEGFEAANLPGKTELYLEGGLIRQRIVAEGMFNPAVLMRCQKGTFGTGTDECNLNTSTQLTNNVTGGFVEATFDSKSSKTTCKEGLPKAEAGEWKGSLNIKPTKAEKTAGVEAIKVE